MRRQFLISLRLFVILSVATGLAYPLFVTGLARFIFPWQAGGSLIVRSGAVRGSTLIGQKFAEATYFRSRPSAVEYAPLPSGGSNLGAIDLRLKAAVDERRLLFRTENGLGRTATVPSDMLFASGSGLDPQCSPEAARLQTKRIAAVRGFGPAQKAALDSLVERSVERPQLGFIGQQRINVALLNLSLASLEVK